MSDDYVCAGRRKTRGDKRAKARYMRYKKGGAQRVTAISLSGTKKN
jgi:hypothetical protein